MKIKPPFEVFVNCYGDWWLAVYKYNWDWDYYVEGFLLLQNPSADTKKLFWTYDLTGSKKLQNKVRNNT